MDILLGWLRLLWEETWGRSLVLIGLVGNIVTFFLPGLQLRLLRDVAYVLLAIGFLWANYNVYKKTAAKITDARNLTDRMHAEQISTLQQQIVELRRKPYNEELERSAGQLISQLTENGRRLLRHLLQNEPLEVGRQFIPQISADEQAQQLGIAMNAKIVRHHEIHVGSGALIRTDYEINPQYRPVLEALLY